MPTKKKEPLDAEAKEARGFEARGLLENPLLNEAMDYWEEVCKDTFANSQPDQPEVRELAYQQLHAGRIVRSYLTRLVTTGKVAAAQAAAAQAANGGTGDSRSERDTH